MNRVIMPNERYLQRKRLLKALWFLFCFTLAAIVRIYKISDIPYGIHIDEAGMGYDAWSLQKYHVDRWLDSFPVYLSNFGDGQSALYTYLCAVFIHFLGGGAWDIVWMRLPGIILNLVAYIAGIQIIGKIFEEKWKLFSAFLLAILPYFIMQCRFGLDCNLLVSMLTISLFFLCISLEHRKIWLFLLTGIFYGLTYYTYVLSYIPNTLLLLLMTLYLFSKDKRLLPKLLCVWIPAGLIAFPLFLVVLINQFDLPQIEVGLITITKLVHYRGGEFDLQLPLVLKNSGMVLSSILSKDYLPYNAFNKYYTMYGISIPFIVVGFYDCTKHAINNIKEKSKDIDYSVILWSTFTLYFIFGCLLGGDNANVNKMNGIFFPQFFLLVWGIRKVYDWFEKKYVKSVKIYMSLLCAVYLLSFTSFTHYYFVDYAKDIYPQSLFEDTYAGILEHLRENHLEQNRIYVPESSYIYYLLSADRNPYELTIYDGWISEIDNFYFSFPDEVDPAAVYIIRDTDLRYFGDALLKNGLELQYSEGMRQCYYKTSP